MNCGIVIVHGKSEKNIAEYVKSTFRTQIVILGEKKGSNSIQIDGLKTFLNDPRFRTKKSCMEEFSLNDNFTIFAIMDLDDVTDLQTKNAYKSNETLPGMGDSWIKNYLSFIYCDENLESVLKDIDYYYAKDKKGKSEYCKVFPKQDKNSDSRSEVECFRNRLSKCNLTNLEEFIDFCIENRSSYI